MSMHKTPLTALEETGLKAHGLVVGKASQLSDAFRLGVLWAKKHVQVVHEPKLINFDSLALGARFSYQGGQNILIKVGENKVVQYDEEMISHEDWVGQGIFLAKDDENEELIVLFHS